MMRHALVIVLVAVSLRVSAAQPRAQKVPVSPEVEKDCDEQGELPLLPEEDWPVEKLDIPDSSVVNGAKLYSGSNSVGSTQEKSTDNLSGQKVERWSDVPKNSGERNIEYLGPIPARTFSPSDRFASSTGRPIERLDSTPAPTSAAQSQFEYPSTLQPIERLDTTPTFISSNRLPVATDLPIERLDTTPASSTSTLTQFEYLAPSPEASSGIPQTLVQTTASPTVPPLPVAIVDQPYTSSPATRKFDVFERLDSTPVPTTSTQSQFEYLAPIPEASTAAAQPLVQTTASPTVRPAPVAIVQKSSSSEAPTTRKYDGFELIGSIQNSELTTSPTDAPASSSTTSKYDGFELVGGITEESGDKYAGFEKLGDVEDVPTTPPSPQAAPLSDGLEFVGEEPPSTVVPIEESTVQVVQSTAPPAPVNLVPIETPATTTTPATSKYSGFVYYGQEKIQPPVVVVDPTTTKAPETTQTARPSTEVGPIVENHGSQNEQKFGSDAGTTEATTLSTTEDPLFFFGTPTEPPVNVVETSTLAPSTDSPLEYLGPASNTDNKYEGFEYFGSSTQKPCESSTITAIPPVNVASSSPESAELIGEWPPANSQTPDKTDVENFVDVTPSSTVQPSGSHQPSIQEFQPTSEAPNQPPPVWNHESNSYQNVQQPEYSSQQFFDGNHYGGVEYVPDNYQEQQYKPQEYDQNYYQVPVQTPSHPGVEFRYLMPKQDPERPVPFVDVDSRERRLVDSFDTPDDLPLKEEDEYPAFWNPFDHAYSSLDELLRTFFGTPGVYGEVRDAFDVPEDFSAHAHSEFSGSPDPEPVDDTFQSVPDHPEVVKSAFEIAPSDSGIIVDTFQLPEEENDHYGGYRKKREALHKHSKPCKAHENEHQKPIDKALEVCKLRPNGHLIALRKCQRDFFVCGVPVRAFRCEDSDSVFVAKKKGCIKKREARCEKSTHKISFRKRPCKNKTAAFVQTRKEKDPRCEGQPLDTLVAIKKCSRDYLQCSSPIRFLSCPGEGQAFSQEAQSCVPSNSVEECSGPTKQAQISASNQKEEPQSVDFFCELKSDGFYRHPRNCSRVVQCFANEIFEYPTCPQGLFFDETRRVCDYKENVPECKAPPAEDIQPRTDENPAHQGTICSSHSHGDHVQHPTDCSRFYRCVWGRAELMSCPETTVFNPALNVCDYPSAVAQCSSSR